MAAATIGIVLGSGPATVQAAASPWAKTEHSAVRLISPASGAGDKETLRLGLQFRLKPGWKIYWRSPGDAGVPPSIDWAGSENLRAASILWPLPERFTIFGLTTQVYGKEVVLPLDLTRRDADAPLSLRAEVRYLVCEKICIPYEARLALDLEAGAGEAAPGHAAAIERHAARVPRRLAGAEAAAAPMSVTRARLLRDGERLTVEVLARSRDGFAAPRLLVEGPRPLRFGAARAELADDKRVALFRVPVAVPGSGTAAPKTPKLVLTLADRGQALEQVLSAPVSEGAGGIGLGLLAVLGLAFIGGLILNLMPCVLPVLSIKLLSVVGHGGAEVAAVRRGFLATAAGIVFSFLVLAAGAIAVKALGAGVGWGIQFQSPLFLIFMAAVLVLFAANLFGLFEIPLPGFAGAAAGLGGGKSIGGAFVTGAFATLLATPCSAPFLGTAIGFALSRGWAEILAVFTMLGLGLAAPYLVVAVWPRVATRLPRPGPWMVTLRRVLAVVLLLTAAWLVSVLLALAGPLTAAMATVLLAVAFAALVARRLLPARRWAALGLAALSLLALLAVPKLAAPPPAAGGGALRDAGITWQAFDKVQLLNHVAQGRTVFVDVTADWCLTCKANKALVIDRGAVAARLGGAEVIAMRADWTRPDPRIAAYLAGFGRFGIPFNAVYGPAAPAGIVLSELLSAREVLAALDTAAGAARAEGK
ncbi:MAG: protein-disulfide reductase DsbD family protein [Alphaproteobacteria bacterium]|nr:protein-disulfide reductase DsbD family protein [Alphaproteobacteria bacterium]